MESVIVKTESAAYAGLSAKDITAIVDQIAGGSAPVDSMSRSAVSGETIRDAAREYFCHLPGDCAGPWRVARVTACRNSWGRWRIIDVDIFEHSAPADAPSETKEAIFDAVIDDPRYSWNRAE